jgi:hypothetical protein
MDKFIGAIGFGDLYLTMVANSSDGKTIKKVNVTFYSGGVPSEGELTESWDFTLDIKNTVQQIDTKEVFHNVHVIDITKGEMYLDSSFKKILLDGIVTGTLPDGKVIKAPIWLEIVPNFSDAGNIVFSSKYNMPRPNCQDYPLYVNSLAFDMVDASAATGDKSGMNVKFGIAQLEQNGDTEIYLETLLSENTPPVGGINTTFSDNDTAFVGNAGIIHKCVYIDGDIIGVDEATKSRNVNYHVYIELDQQLIKV